MYSFSQPLSKGKNKTITITKRSLLLKIIQKVRSSNSNLHRISPHTQCYYPRLWDCDPLKFSPTTRESTPKGREPSTQPEIGFRFYHSKGINPNNYGNSPP
ncbi:hypothetical protein AQUCO_14400003v1 [Aquilegia coerulea]|uniref:Uncharacterized protein n=1 Tax=Aquilegia coerulea TaxID=218851 RepID=A0A2G5C0V7_AQUCA|nr:hypothetical protein AQUCO_14400003v1 [Aquilegia coerulea]